MQVLTYITKNKKEGADEVNVSKKPSHCTTNINMLKNIY